MGLDDGTAPASARRARRVRNAAAATCVGRPPLAAVLAFVAACAGAALALALFAPGAVRGRLHVTPGGGGGAAREVGVAHGAAQERQGARAALEREAPSGVRAAGARAAAREAPQEGARGGRGGGEQQWGTFDPFAAAVRAPSAAGKRCLQDYDARWAAHAGSRLRSGMMPVAFTRLPLAFDAARVRKELAAAMGALFDEATGEVDWLSAGQDGLHGGPGWVARPPDKLRGTNTTKVFNYFWPLVEQEKPTLGAASGNPDGKEGPFCEASNHGLSQLAYTRRLVASLRAPMGRSRLMLVKEGDKVMRHIDLKDHVRRSAVATPVKGYWGRRFRVHLPLTTDASVIFQGTSHGKFHETGATGGGAQTWPGETSINMQEGEAWVFDNGRHHSVLNRWDKPRVHLVVDTVGSLSFFDIVAAGDQVDTNAMAPAPLRLPARPVTVNATARDGAVELTLERWRDRNAFDPMDAASAREYLLGEVAPRVSDSGAREGFKALVKDAMAFWDALPHELSLETAETLHEDAAAEELAIRRSLTEGLRRGTAALACDAADGGAYLRNGGGVTLPDLVDQFADSMLYFECNGIVAGSSGHQPCVYQDEYTPQKLQKPQGAILGHGRNRARGGGQGDGRGGGQGGGQGGARGRARRAGGHGDGAVEFPPSR